MRLRSLAALCLVFSAKALAAQDAAPVYQQPSNTRFRLDAVLRQEWTKDIWVSDTETRDEHRWRIQARPRVEFGTQTFTLGVGGEFNYSSDENTKTETGEKPALIRDNYNSRDARLDLAFARIEPFHWLRLDGGRFEMPVGVTEMIWDRDLRPQGGALTLQAKDQAGVSRFSVTGLYATGSHVFDDKKVDMLMGSAQATFPGAADSSFQLVGTYVEWRNPNNLESMIRRQDSRIDGDFTKDYRVIDAVARIKQGGNMPLQIVADMSWNTAVSDKRRGLWLAAVLGGIKTSRLMAEYTFASIDKDATLAAYDTDDFFWGTGWKGHRLDLGSQTSDKTSLHVVGELMKFKDSPDPDERDHNDKRLRLEIRVRY
jgi:Putative porin